MTKHEACEMTGSWMAVQSGWLEMWPLAAAWGAAALAAPAAVAWGDDGRVTARPGPYYGGWITSEIAGPFKGEPGTEGW